MSDGIVTGDTLEKEFKEHSVAEFFKRNRQMLGLYGKVRSLTTVVHEYVSNSLDACEEAHILPDIEVKLEELGEEYYLLTVKDNGPGLTKNTVGKALGQLLAGTKFHRLMQMRGQQGIGASGATMLSQITTGKATKVISGTGVGKAYACEITIDPKKNQPKIDNMRDLDKKFRGLMVQAKFKNVLYRESSTGPLEYLRRTAIANPHTQIIFVSPKGQKTTFKRTAMHIPKKPKAMKPHPNGITVDEIITMGRATSGRKISSFLKTDFERVGDTSLKKLQKLIKFDLNKDPKQTTWDEAEQIIKGFQKIDFISPSTDGLRPIGENRIKKSLESIVEPEYVYTLTRPPKVYSGGFPFQVEIGIAYGGNAGKGGNGNDEENATKQIMEGENEAKVEIMRFANRAPLLFDSGGCAITKAVHSIEWKRYGVRSLENVPLTIFVNLISVHIPYTGAGKQAITDESDVVEELRLALMQCARKTATYIRTKRRELENKMKRDMFYKYIPEISTALHEITKADKQLMIDKLENLVLTKLKLEKPEEEKQHEKEIADMKKKRIQKFKEDVFGEKVEKKEEGDD